MFHVVQLDSVIFKEKIVVPSIWLDKYDTLCLLPPITDVTDIETLAQAQSTPKHGWQMHSVSFIQSFDTYSQAKQNITKCNPVMINLDEEGEKEHHKKGRGKRKRKLPRFLEQYSIESDYNVKKGCDSTQDCSMKDNAVLVPLIVKIETIEDPNVPESHQQPQLNTTLNKSSSSVHSSLQHDKRLQVTGSSSSTISSLREAVKTFVQYALSNLNDSKLTTVTDAIIAEEPSELQDLLYFKEDDFLPILTKIQARKLMDFIQKSFSTGKRRAEIVEICRKSVEVKKVSTRQALEIEKSVNIVETEPEPQPSNVPSVSTAESEAEPQPSNVPSVSTAEFEAEPPNVQSVSTAESEAEPPNVQSVSTAESEAEPPNVQSVSTAESEAEPPNVPQLFSFVANWANDFEIPYEKFPSAVLKHCREGSRPHPKEKKQVIRILADEISKLIKRPRKKNVEIIVSKLIKQYPKSFQDAIGNKPFGNGYASFLNCLMSRIENQNRAKSDSLIAKLPETHKKVKKRCINFQPDNLPDEETESSQREKQYWLQIHFSRINQNEDEVTRAMTMTFVSQRLTINTVNLVEETVKEWPYLTQTKYLLAHFNEAMKPYQPDWDCIFQRRIPELLTYLRSKIRPVKTSKFSSIAILQLLCAYFKEVNTIVQIYKDCDSIEIINRDTCPVTPFIAVFGTKSAVVFIERKSFSQYVTPDDALKMWFASYFVFNLVYPEECLVTMEFIQRGLMGIPLDSGNKRTINKCLKLVKGLSNYTDLWTITE